MPEQPRKGVKMSKKRKPVTPATGANPERVQAVQQLRRSSAAGSHESGVRGKRTRGGAKRDAIERSADGK